MTSKSIIEQELQAWIESYNKDTNTHRVLLGKYHNFLAIIQKALKEAEKRIDNYLDELTTKEAKQILNDCFGVGK